MHGQPESGVYVHAFAESVRSVLKVFCLQF